MEMNDRNDNDDYASLDGHDNDTRSKKNDDDVKSKNSNIMILNALLSVIGIVIASIALARSSHNDSHDNNNNHNYYYKNTTQIYGYNEKVLEFSSQSSISGVSLAIAPDHTPVASMYEVVDNDNEAYVRYMKCSTSDCKSFESKRLVKLKYATEIVQGTTEIHIGSDHLPVIVYSDLPCHVIHCKDLNCDSTTISDLGNEINSQSPFSSIVNGAGNLMIGWAGFDLKYHLLECKKADCSQYESRAFTSYSTYEFFDGMHLTNPGPMITFHSPGKNVGSNFSWKQVRAHIFRCNDTSCNAYEELSVPDQTSTLANITQMSMGKGVGGTPLIIYRRVDGLHVLRCTRIGDCHESTKIPFVVNQAGGYPCVVSRNGIVSVVYVDRLKGNHLSMFSFNEWSMSTNHWVAPQGILNEYASSDWLFGWHGVLRKGNHLMLNLGHSKLLHVQYTNNELIEYD